MRRVLNSSRSSVRVVLCFGLALLGLRENTAAAIDHNADGDQDDATYGVIDLRTSALQDIPIAAYSPSARLAGDSLAFLVEEFEQGTTALNCDGLVKGGG